MTIAEQFKDDWKNRETSGAESIHNAIERIEARIAAQQLAMDVMALHIAALEHPQDAKPQGREWVELPYGYWMWYPDGDLRKTLPEDQEEWVSIPTHIMPYDPEHPEKPDAPEVTK